MDFTNAEKLEKLALTNARELGFDAPSEKLLGAKDLYEMWVVASTHLVGDPLDGIYEERIGAGKEWVAGFSFGRSEGADFHGPARSWYFYLGIRVGHAVRNGALARKLGCPA